MAVLGYVGDDGAVNTSCRAGHDRPQEGQHLPIGGTSRIGATPSSGDHRSWFIEDLGSTTGSTSGWRIEAKKALHVNDEIRQRHDPLFHGITSEPIATTTPAAKKPDLTRKQLGECSGTLAATGEGPACTLLHH
jgi:hypothetical protein